jgi:glyoxylase-like metal-dependent hydrolase (beta-lactamase superfamily II)
MSQLLPNVHMLDDSRGANVYLIIDDGITLIDTGMNGNPTKILAELKKLGFGRQDIKNIVITHAHVDHLQCLAELKEGTTARVMAGEADVGVINGSRPTPLPKSAMGVLFRLAGPMMRFRPTSVDVPLRDGDVIDVLGGLRVVALPGHTPGNIGLYQPRLRLVFSSDTVGNRNDGLRVPLFYRSNRDECNAAIKRLSELDADIMLPGHGSPIRPQASQKVRAFHDKLVRDQAERGKV